MKLLKQLSIFSIFLLASSQTMLAMQAPDEAAEATEPVEAVEQTPSENGSWFTRGRIAAAATQLGLSAVVWRAFGRGPALLSTLFVPSIMVGSRIGGLFGTAANDNAQEGLEITAEEQAMLDAAKAENLSVWQYLLLNVLMGSFKESKAVFKDYVVKMTDPYWLIKINPANGYLVNCQHIDAFIQSKQLDAFMEVLKAYIATYIEELERTCTKLNRAARCY